MSIFNSKTASVVNLLVNIFLFLFKIIVGYIFSSLSLIGDALNSLTDIIAALGIVVAVRINNKKPDENHPFGHTRAESIAGYTTGVLMILLSFNLTYNGIMGFFGESVVEYNSILFLPILATLLLKMILFVYIHKILKKENSPALKANLQDHKNDILISLMIFIGFILIKFGLVWVDSLMAILLGLYIFKSAISICLDNTNQLMGKRATEEEEEIIKEKILEIQEVLKIKNLKTQLLGSKIQVETTILVDENMSMKQGHKIYHKIAEKVLKLDNILHCTVHLEIE